jgi:hypothetical protein
MFMRLSMAMAGQCRGRFIRCTRAHRRIPCCPSSLILCHCSRRLLSARRCPSFWWLRAIPPRGRLDSLTPLILGEVGDTDLAARHLLHVLQRRSATATYVKGRQDLVQRQERFRRLPPWCVHFLSSSEVLLELRLPLPLLRGHSLLSRDGMHLPSPGGAAGVNRALSSKPARAPTQKDSERPLRRRLPILGYIMPSR